MSSKVVDNFKLEKIVEILDKHCIGVDMSRFDKTSDEIEVSFIVNIKDFVDFNKITGELEKLNNSVQVSFLDNKGLS